MKSIYMNMPVPLAIVGGEAFGNFAIISVENAANHLLGHGIPLKTLELNKSSDWKNSNDCFHTLFHEELCKKLQKVEHCLKICAFTHFIFGQMGFRKTHL